MNPQRSAPSGMPAAYEPKTSDAAVKKATGRTWPEWFALLDAFGAKDKGHQQSARHLWKDVGLSPWWSQMVTVEYERARGIRKVGQRTGGDWEVTLQRTVAASPADCLAAFTDSKFRQKWVKGLKAHLGKAWATKRQTTTSLGEVLRYDVPTKDGTQKLDVTFTPKDKKTAVRVQHRELASKEQRDQLKDAWGEALDALAEHLAKA